MKVIAILLAVCLALVAASYHNNYRYRSYKPSSYRRYNNYNRRYNSYRPYNRRYNHGSHYRPKYSSYYGKY